MQSTGKRRFRRPVTEDVHHIITHVAGSNIYKTGEDIKIKDDSEYPDWIWTMRLEGHPNLDDLDPNEHQYWEQLDFMSHIRQLRMYGLKPKVKKQTSELEINQEIWRDRIKFRALASYHHEPGTDPKDYESIPHRKTWLKPQESLEEEEIYPDQFVKDHPENFHSNRHCNDPVVPRSKFIRRQYGIRRNEDCLLNSTVDFKRYMPQESKSEDPKSDQQTLNPSSAVDSQN